MKSYMRILRSVVLVAALVPMVMQAALLTPGGTSPAIAQPDPTGGTTIATTTQPFSAPSFTGTITSSVIANDTSNPWVGIGGLTFTYSFTLNPSSPQAVHNFTATSFVGFQTDFSYFGSGLLAATSPSSFERSSDGQVARFVFSPEVFAGQSSALLVVQTDANSYMPGFAGVINGTAAYVTSFAPTTIPEPTVFALALAGFATLALRRKI